MSEPFRRRSAALLLYLAVTLVPAVPAASGDDSAIVVRVYGGPSTDSPLRADAIREASAILAETGLLVSWHDCTGDASRRHCDHLRGARSLIIRIAPAYVPGAPASPSSIAPRAGREAAAVVLGIAVIEPVSGDGVMATVFLDRIEAVARRTGVAMGSLLGRAIAHETGHLLLASSAHSRSGLMRDIWTDGELTIDRREDWLFAPDDRQRLLTLRRQPAPLVASTATHP